MQPYLVVNEPTEATEEIAKRVGNLNSRARRRMTAFMRRRFRKKARRYITMSRVIGIGDVPEGSLLSEETLAAIANGDYRLAIDVPIPSTPPLRKSKKKKTPSDQRRAQRRHEEFARVYTQISGKA